jgi:hypothetical protein
LTQGKEGNICDDADLDWGMNLSWKRSGREEDIKGSPDCPFPHWKSIGSSTADASEVKERIAGEGTMVGSSGRRDNGAES